MDLRDGTLGDSHCQRRLRARVSHHGLGLRGEGSEKHRAVYIPRIHGKTSDVSSQLEP